MTGRAARASDRAGTESLRGQLEALRALEAELLAENKRLREAQAGKLGAGASPERRGVVEGD